MSGDERQERGRRFGEIALQLGTARLVRQDQETPFVYHLRLLLWLVDNAEGKKTLKEAFTLMESELGHAAQEGQVSQGSEYQHQEAQE